MEELTKQYKMQKKFMMQSQILDAVLFQSVIVGLLSITQKHDN